jgi:DNA-binding GntR family transcriptional regulator
MVEIIPWRGARVINPSLDEIADLFDLLAAVEGVVARLAARHATAKDIRHYVERIEEERRALRARKPDIYHVIHLSYQAAEVLAASCGSPMAANMVRRIGRPAYWLHRFLLPPPPRWVQQSLDRQDALVAALRARDEKRAERAARELVTHTKRLILARARDVEAAQGLLRHMPAWNAPVRRGTR